MTATTQDALTAVVARHATLTQARGAVDDAYAALCRDVTAAVAAGVPKADLARAIGVTRPVIYAMLDREVTP